MENGELIRAQRELEQGDLARATALIREQVSELRTSALLGQAPDTAVLEAVRIWWRNAACNKDSAMVEKLIEIGSLGLFGLACLPDAWKSWPLHSMILSHWDAGIERLYSAGIAYANEHGTLTALHVAAGAGWTELVKSFIARGVSPDMPNTELVAFLVAAGADLERRNSSANTPVMAAIIAHNVLKAELLMSLYGPEKPKNWKSLVEVVEDVKRQLDTMRSRL